MSPENVEIVRAAFDAYSRGDIERLLGLMDPEIVLDAGSHGDRATSNRHLQHAGKGLDDLVRVNKNSLDSFEEWSIERMERTAP